MSFKEASSQIDLGMVILNFKLFRFFLTVFVARKCLNEFLSLLDAAWANIFLFYLFICSRLSVLQQFIL